MIDLGMERPDYGNSEVAAPTPKKTKICYPSITIEKSIKKGLGFNDTFEARVKFRVMNVSDGKQFESEKPATRMVLELISMDEIAGKKSEGQDIIEDAVRGQREGKPKKGDKK